jgi:hypothetical protein
MHHLPLTLHLPTRQLSGITQVLNLMLSAEGRSLNFSGDPISKPSYVCGEDTHPTLVAHIIHLDPYHPAHVLCSSSIML